MCKDKSDKSVRPKSNNLNTPLRILLRILLQAVLEDLVYLEKFN